MRFKASIREEKDKLEGAGVGIIGLVYGKRIEGAPKSEAYEIICTYDCSESEARKILGSVEVDDIDDVEKIEEVAEKVAEKVAKTGNCIATTARGTPCKNKAVCGGEYCSAHKK